MDHTGHSRVFSSVTRLLALLESIAKVPHQQVAKRANRPNRPFLIIIVSSASIGARGKYMPLHAVLFRSIIILGVRLTVEKVMTWPTFLHAHCCAKHQVHNYAFSETCKI